MGKGITDDEELSDAANLTKLFDAKEGFEARVGISISELTEETARPLQVMVRALAEHHMACQVPSHSSEFQTTPHDIRLFTRFDFRRMSEASTFLTDVFKLLRLNKIEVTISNPHQHHKPG